MLLTEVHGAPLRSPMTTPPRRVLEIGCGPGIWSLMCHRHFKKLGHTGISFVGVDIAPPNTGVMTPDSDMDWTYVQHDVTKMPWPFADGHFDLIFHKEMTLAVPVADHPAFSLECARVIAPGGYIEIWEVDHMIRLLRPHTPSDKDRGVMARGAYAYNISTPLSAPQNPYLVEYNNWLTQAFEKRGVMVNPCTVMQHYLLSEENVTEVRSQRLLIPFSEIRWEGQGGVAKVITKDGKAYVKGTTGGGDAAMSKSAAAAAAAGGTSQKPEANKLTDVALAVRRTALLTLVQEIQAEELMLREVNGKGQDEWNSWVDKMTHDLMEEGGTRWGECLETGAWWARKKRVGEK
jgi:ubiquinone/menaquinone biosynthesis C-methylase UbiE